MPEQRWIFTPEPDHEIVEDLAKSINNNWIIAKLLVQRQILTYQDAQKYFNPTLQPLHDPFLMKDMDLAIELLLSKINLNEKILIYGDYDVDGTTSVALVYSYLKTFHSNLIYYINDREKEGYGISDQGIDYAKNEGVSLIISLDCGIKAGKQVKMARELGIDFIICDHHNPGEELPPANAILDPKRKDCPYPYKELSGCGVGYKLLEAYEKHTGENYKLENYLDLVAVSITADVVPITGENRILCSKGLEILNTTPRPGLEALINMNAKGTITTSSIMFGIAPKINAAGRLAHAQQSVDLLIAKDLKLAKVMASGIEKRNSERKDFDTLITEEALEKIKSLHPDKKSTVLYNENWHKGVIGIVASRVIEHFHRPTIILTESNGSATGSARSVPGFDIYSAIEKCEGFLDKFGGHTFAAGLTMGIDKIQEFSKQFEAVVSDQIKEHQLQPSIEINTELKFDVITDKFRQKLNRMEPFGQDNPQPVFIAHNISVHGQVRVLKEKHIKFTIGQEGSNKEFDAIGFNQAQFKNLLEEAKKPCSIVFTVETNEYKGSINTQLRIKDIKFNYNGAQS